MKLSLVAGTTSKLLNVFLEDVNATNETDIGLAGVVYNSPGLTARYKREGDASWTNIPLVSATAGTFASGGFCTPGNAPDGLYEFHPPNAALAAGAKSVLIALFGASGMLPVLIEIELTATNNQDNVRGGLTGIPNAAAGSSGGLPTIDASLRVSADVNAIRGQTNPAINLEDDYDGTGYNKSNSTIGTVTNLAAAAVASIWNALTSGLTTVGSIGKWLLDNAGGGGSAVTFNVVPSVVSGGDVASGPITAYLSAGDQRSIAVVDQNGTAINLSGETLQFIVESEEGAADVFVKESGSGVAVGGAGNNVVTATYAAADVPTAGKYLYAIRRTSDGKVFAEGEWIIKRAARKDAA